MKKKTKPIISNDSVILNYKIDTGVIRMMAQWNAQMQLARQSLTNAVTSMSEIAVRVW